MGQGEERRTAIHMEFKLPAEPSPQIARWSHLHVEVGEPFQAHRVMPIHPLDFIGQVFNGGTQAKGKAPEMDNGTGTGHQRSEVTGGDGTHLNQREGGLYAVRSTNCIPSRVDMT